MTDEEILKKAIMKSDHNVSSVGVVNCGNLLRVDVYKHHETFPSISIPYQCVIFSHDFAKAFWGEKLYNTSEVIGEVQAIDYTGSSSYIYKKIPLWQYHLQQMVLEEEPLKYLEKFLKD